MTGSEVRAERAHEPFAPPAASTAAPAPRAKGGWKANLLLALGSTLFSLALAGGLGEWAMRYREGHRATVPGTMPLIFYKHGRLGHALVRGHDYYGWNSVGIEGFRGSRPVSLMKAPGSYRIIVAGGSTTFDTFVSNDSSAWPARLERWLAREMPDRRVEVLNAGVPGYRVEQDLVRLQSELYRWQPDLIILYQGHNDLYNTLVSALRPPRAPERRPDEVQPMSPWTHWLSAHSMLYTKLAERGIAFGVRRSGGQAKRREDTEARLLAAIDSGAIRYGRDVAFYLAAARTLGIPVLVPEVTHVSGVEVDREADPRIAAVWRGGVTYAEPDLMLRGYVRYAETARAVAEREGGTFVRTNQCGLRGTEFYVESDPIHFSDAGADRMGRCLADYLRANGLPTAAPATTPSSGGGPVAAR